MVYFEKEINKLTNHKKVLIYVDMDGVLADYIVGEPFDYHLKRPLISNIDALKKINEINNVEMHILSICKKDHQVDEKNIWLDQNAPFFKLENRAIISKETYANTSSPKLKSNYLNSLILEDDNVVVLIDDDPSVLKEIRNKNKDIILFKDTVLVD